jgi:hypothetical protein
MGPEGNCTWTGSIDGRNTKLDDSQGVKVYVELTLKLALNFLYPFPNLRNALYGKIWLEGRR